VPMREGFNELRYWTSANLPPEQQVPQALATSVSPDYLKVMEIPLRQGRFFNEEDRQGKERVIVIDEVLAARAFGGENPIGKRLWIPGTSSPFTENQTAPDAAMIVGVVGHVRYWGMAKDDQSELRAQVYYPFAQVPDGLVRRWSELTSLVVRTGVAPLSVVQSLRAKLRGATGDQVLYAVQTMEQLAAGTLALQRFLLLLFGIFAGLALSLACVGIYGVLAYLTSRRMPEIGVRMALGAQPRDVLRLVLGDSLGLIAIGIGSGMVGAAIAARVLKRWVDGVQSAEPATWALMLAVLVAAALAASFVPARRASRADPMTTLRQE
jgi:predicted permease